MDHRIEQDTLGEVEIPINAYYGAQTKRALDNFQVSTLKLQPSFIRSQAIIKRAAASANEASGHLENKIAKAIKEAADEVMSGKFVDQFVVDAFQAGAGTSQNMNINEVLANRAEEILGGKRGDYKKVHPNDHVNMGQSTNDTIHTAIHIAAYTDIQKNLLPAMAELQKSLEKKSEEFDDIVKAGRTHLQDAVPMTLGQEFGGFAGMLKNNRRRLESASYALLELCIGGTAVGTGLNTNPNYRENMIKNINELTGYSFRTADNMFEAMQALDAVLETTGALRILITSLCKIADDFRLLSSGPLTGLGEIALPAVQPGSSIMPGKINPVMAEMLNMVCFHALGCDTAILHSAQAGQLQLNVMMPIVVYNLLLEIEILAGGMQSFNDKCAKGIKANEETCRSHAERTSALATALSPHIGYFETAKLVKESLEKNLSIKELAKSRKIMDIDKLENILNLKAMTDGLGDVKIDK